MATSSQRVSNGVRHRCDCFSSATTSILYGLRREAPPTERSTLERLLNVLSRAAHKDSKNPQRIWSQEPEWWSECSPLPWKNPREHPKDKKDVLVAKVDILQTQLRNRGLLTCELEEEWQLYKNSNKTDMERKSDFEAIIAKSSGLHHMLDRVREKVNGAYSVNDKIAGYICQIKACLERSLHEVRAMYSFVEEKERGKKKLWDQMGIMRPAKRLRIISSATDNDDDLLSPSPTSYDILDLESDPLPSPTTGEDGASYPSLESLAEKEIAGPLCSDITMNSDSPLTDCDEAEEDTFVRHQAGGTFSDNPTTSDGQHPVDQSALDLSYKGVPIACEITPSKDATQRGNPISPTSTDNRGEPAPAVIQSKISEASKSEFSSDPLHTSTKMPVVTLATPVTSTNMSSESTNKAITCTNASLKSSDLPLISSHVPIMSSYLNLLPSDVLVNPSVMSFGSSAVPDVSSHKPVVSSIPGSPVRCESDPGFAETEMLKIPLPGHSKHISPLHPHLKSVEIRSGTITPKRFPKSSPSSQSSDITGRAVSHAHCRSSASKKPPARNSVASGLVPPDKTSPAAPLKATDNETELAVSSILLLESSVNKETFDHDDIIIADDDILNEVEEIIEESPAPTVRMYVTGDGGYDMETSPSTDCDGHVGFEDILPSVEGLIMMGLSEGGTEWSAALGKNSTSLGAQTETILRHKIVRISPNSLSFDIGREVVP